VEILKPGRKVMKVASFFDFFMPLMAFSSKQADKCTINVDALFFTFLGAEQGHSAGLKDES